MSERRVVLDTAAFMDAPAAAAIEGATTDGIRTIVRRFLTACYDELGKTPRLLDGDDMATLCREVLPRHFGVRDPLADATEAVLAAYLEFLRDSAVVPESFEQRRGLAEHAAAFRDAIASGAAHADGVAAVAGTPTVVHRAGKTGRNDPCPCGSGKKFKKCCMRLGSGGDS